MTHTRLLLDLTPLRTSTAYRRLWWGTALTGTGTQLTNVAVGLQVYDLTGSTLRVGLVGLFALVPLVVMGLYGGALVDAHDRRLIVVVATAGTAVVAAAFAVQAVLGTDQVWLLYILVGLQSGLFGLNNPARSAMAPRLLPLELLPAANALGSLSFAVAASVGPLLAGVLINWFGFSAAYGADAVLAVAALATLVGLPAVPPEGPPQRAGLTSVIMGFRFLTTRPNLRMTFLVDLAAMVLALPRVLFPAVGAVWIGGGATTVGILVAALAGGSIMAGLLSGPLGTVRRQGRAVVVSVIVWGLAVAAFGVVVAISPMLGSDAEAVGALPGLVNGAAPTLIPAALLLVVAGAADAVSSVFRTTILQAATPDALRGRLQGVFIVVVAGGPRLGDVVLGAVAGLTTEAVAGIGGGLVCVVVVVLLAAWQRGFLRYDARTPEP